MQETIQVKKEETSIEVRNLKGNIIANIIVLDGGEGVTVIEVFRNKKNTVLRDRK